MVHIRHTQAAGRDEHWHKCSAVLRREPGLVALPSRQGTLGKTETQDRAIREQERFTGGRARRKRSGRGSRGSPLGQRCGALGTALPWERSAKEGLRQYQKAAVGTAGPCSELELLRRDQDAILVSIEPAGQGRQRGAAHAAGLPRLLGVICGVRPLPLPPSWAAYRQSCHLSARA